MNVGDAVPTLDRTIELTDMVAYAGATWDWHRLHYDAEFATTRGVASPVVDGQMLGALMAEHAMDHLGPGAFITKLGFRLRSAVVAGDSVRVEGEITAVEPGSVTLNQRVLVGDRLAADGTATLRL